VSLSPQRQRPLWEDFRVFLRDKKSVWLAPLVFFLLLLGSLFLFLEGSVRIPFIYINF
jgi:hypothetical protein